MDEDRSGPGSASEDQRERLRWSRQHSYGCLVLIGVLTALIAVIGVCSALSGGTEEPVQVQIQNEQTKVPAVLPPSPTPTPALPSCPTEAEWEYFDAGWRSMAVIKDSFFNELAEDIRRAQADPWLYYDEMWRDNVMAWLTNAAVAAELFAAEPGPPSTAEIRQDMIQLASLTREIDEAFTQEFTGWDAGLPEGEHWQTFETNFDLIATILLVHQFDEIWYIERFCEKRQ